MGEDCGTWIPHMQFGWQSPNLSSFGASLHVGKQNGASAVMNPGVNLVSRNETMPAYVSSALPHLQLGHSDEPHGGFYCLPRFRQQLTPAPNFTAEVELTADHVKSLRDKTTRYGETGSPQKQFLVIDQTGGHTAIVYDSRSVSPNQCLASLNSNLHVANYLNGNEPSLRRDLNHMTVPTLADKVDKNQVTGIESEMHEDTEEINALLYSDSDGYSNEDDDDDDDDDDDEFTSTGHSPSTMTTHGSQEILKGTTEIVSSAMKTKKRKLFDGYYDDMQLMDTASSLNQSKSLALGNDAESRCSSGKGKGLSEMGSLSSNKKMRKERIRDLLSILQSIIPGGKDKDPVMLLDDAIRCLKSLKHKAKALGLNAL